MTTLAVRVREHGGPDVLRLEEIPTPAPGRGQILVRVIAAGVNFLDIRHRTGDALVELPVTLGIEGAGIVEAVGPGVDPGVRVGQRVAWQMQQGSYTTHALVAVDAVVPLPDFVDMTTGAAVLLQGLTAHVLACSAYRITAPETCLVHAAAGGVGSLLVQIAAARGARVIGTVSSPAKVERVRKAGADEVIVRTREDFAAEVRRFTGGGVDVVYDGVGRDTFFGSLASLRSMGSLVLYGQASGAVPAFDTQLLARDGGRYLTRATLGQHITDRAGLLARAGELFDGIASGTLQPYIEDVYPLRDAARAHAALGSGRTMGKLLLATDQV